MLLDGAKGVLARLAQLCGWTEVRRERTKGWRSGAEEAALERRERSSAERASQLQRKCSDGLDQSIERMFSWIGQKGDEQGL